MLQWRNCMIPLALFAAVSPPVDLARAQTTQPAYMEFGLNASEIPVEPAVNQTSPRTVELLGQSMVTAPTIARLAELVHDLGTCRLPGASKYLVPALVHHDEVVRAETARSLAMIGDRSSVAKLELLLADDSAMVRREAVLAGAALGEVAFAGKGIGDADPGVIVAGLNASSPSDTDMIASRIPAWQADVKEAAIRALARHGAVQHASIIAQCLDGSVPVRCAAVEALGVLRAMQFEPEVRELLGDKHPAVRREAIHALASLVPDSEASVAAMAMLSDSDPSVREAAVRALAAHPSAGATELLVSQLSSPYPPLRIAARDALVASSKLGIGGIPEMAVALLKGSDPRCRKDGSYLLGKLRSGAAIEEHIALLKEEDLLVATQAAESLGEIGNPVAAPALCELSQRTVPEAQSSGESDASSNQASRAGCAAIIACAKLGYQPLREVVKPLIGKQVARSTPLRAAAIWAFGVIGTPDDEATCQQLLSFHADPYEATIVKYEAIKAIGNLRYAKAASRLKEIEDTETYNPLRWIAHQSSDRIAGTHTEFIAQPAPWTADVSIVDVARP